MEDDYEGTDWFFNNQNYEDFAGKYVLLAKAPVSDLEPHEIIENDEEKETDIEDVEYNILKGHKVGGQRVRSPL